METKMAGYGAVYFRFKSSLRHLVCGLGKTFDFLGPLPAPPPITHTLPCRLRSLPAPTRLSVLEGEAPPLRFRSSQASEAAGREMSKPQRSLGTGCPGGALSLKGELWGLEESCKA